MVGRSGTKLNIMTVFLTIYFEIFFNNLLSCFVVGEPGWVWAAFAFNTHAREELLKWSAPILFDNFTLTREEGLVLKDSPLKSSLSFSKTKGEEPA